MIKSVPFANAVTIVTLGLYVVCRIVSLVTPDFLFSISKSWFHTFSMDSVRATVPMDWGVFIFGAITLAVLAWVTAYATIELYNRLGKK